MSPTLNVNPTFLVKNFFGGGGGVFSVAIIVTYKVICHPNFNHPWQYFITGQWMNSSIIHDSICKLIHKKCHMKSYHSDIKYHMTLNNILIVHNSSWTFQKCMKTHDLGLSSVRLHVFGSLSFPITPMLSESLRSLLSETHL